MNGVQTNHINSDEPFGVEIKFKILEDLTQFRVGIYVRNGLGNVLFRSCTSDWRPELEKIKKGEYTASLQFPEKLLRAGGYFISIHLGRYGIINYLAKQSVEKSITIGPSAYYNQAHPVEKPDSELLLNKEWILEKKDYD